MTLKVVQGFVGPARPTVKEATQSLSPQSSTQISQNATRNTQVITEAVVTTIKASPRALVNADRPKSDHEAKALADKVAKAISQDEGETFELAHSVDYLAKSGNSKNYLA